MFIKNKIILPVCIWMILVGSVNCKQEIFKNEKINFVYSSSTNDLWVGSSDGIYRVKDGKYTKAKNIKKGQGVKGIAEDTTKNIYFGAGSKIVYYNTENESEEKTIDPAGMGRQDSYVNCLAIDKNNNLWIGRYNDMLVKYNGKSYERFPVWDVNSIDVTSSGDTWIATKSGLYRVKNGVLEEFNKDNSPLPDNDIKHILIDIYDNLWISTSNGLIKYNQHVWIIYNNENSPLKNNQVTTVYLDKEGSLIVGMQSGDLQIMKNGKWQELDLALKNQAINNIFKDSNDLLLLGTDSGLIISK